ncbi:MAG: T9SS type A sorting domain-containing protein [Candidatus Aegiribacteria sp.]|nr:T9SS type A sorting domain-containing protein [Candidatus Aegiribacteria sp.]
MRYLLSIMILLVLDAFAYVDVVGCSSGNFVVWDNGVGAVRLAEIEGSQDTLEFGLNNPSLGYTVIDGEPRLVLTTYSYNQLVADSLFLIDPLPLFVVGSRSVASSDLCWLSMPSIVEGSIKTARHQNEEDAFYISADAYLPISGAGEGNVISARFQCDTSGELYITDTLGVSIDSYSGGINSYSSPVSCSSSNPSQLWSYINSYMFPSYAVYAGVHQIDGDPVPGDFEPMLHDCFYSTDYGGEVRAVGSCATEVLGFWTTNGNTELWYSVIQPGAVEPDSSEPAPYGIPVQSAIAMSANPDDDGLLLVWQQGNELRCAHWDGEWNSFNHVVETGLPGLCNGNLAVCSVDSGYIVVWDSYPVPETRFIARDMVTSIVGSQGDPLQDDIQVSPNPVLSGQTAMISLGSASNVGSIEVYDLNGRLIRELEPDESGNASFDTSGIPQGTYFVRSMTAGDASTRKILLLSE